MDDFEVTKEILDIFGTGYTKNEYKEMWDKYKNSIENVPVIYDGQVIGLGKNKIGGRFECILWDKFITIETNYDGSCGAIILNKPCKLINNE